MIRILIASEQSSVRQEIKSLLNKDPDLKAIATVRDGRSAVKQVDLLSPEIVLLDLEMPLMNGITAAKYINHLYPDTKVIILSSREEPKYVVQSLVAGARAYILQHSLRSDLKQMIVAVNSGYSQIESRLLAKIFKPANLKKSSQSSASSSKAKVTDSQVNNFTDTNKDAAKTQQNTPVVPSEQQPIHTELNNESSLPASARLVEVTSFRLEEEGDTSKDTDVPPRQDTQDRQADNNHQTQAPNSRSDQTKPLNASRSSQRERTATATEFQEYGQQAIAPQQLKQNSFSSRHRSKLVAAIFQEYWQQAIAPQQLKQNSSSSRQRPRFMTAIKSRLAKNWISYILCIILGAIIVTVLQGL